MTKQNETGYITCPKCNSPAYKLYSLSEAEKIANGDMQLELNLKKEYQCSRQSCSNVFQVTLTDITKAFVKKRIDEGNSKVDIKKELLNLSLKKITDNAKNRKKG